MSRSRVVVRKGPAGRLGNPEVRDEKEVDMVVLAIPVEVRFGEEERREELPG